MVRVKSNIVFSDVSASRLGKSVQKDEKRRVSYWLEKLYAQRERIRKHNTQVDAQSVIDSDKLSLNDVSVSKKDLSQSGINEHTINIATKKEEDTQIVDDLVKKSNRCIISITSGFPLDFFPSTIIVEESRVTFMFKQFMSSQSHSVDIKDISNVFIESSMFFSTLQVVSRTYIQNDIKIGYLNKTKAREVQNIIEGLRTFAENNINTSNYEIPELISKIGELHAE